MDEQTNFGAFPLLHKIFFGPHKQIQKVNFQISLLITDLGKYLNLIH